MAAQLQIYVNSWPNSFYVHSKAVLGWRTIKRTTRLRFQADDGFFVNRDSPTSADGRVSFTKRGNGMLRSSVAAPGNSSLLRSGRLQEMNIHARDRFMQIAEWVYRKVKDPMVEIDPITVDKKIKAEEEQAREEQKAKERHTIEHNECEPIESSEETITTVAPSTFVSLPPGVSRLNLSTKIAGAGLIFAAVFLAYLGFRSKSALLRKSKQISGASPTSAGIAAKRDTGTSKVHHSPSFNEGSPSQDLREQFRYSRDADSSDKAATVRASFVLPSYQSQTTETLVPSRGEETLSTSSPSVIHKDAKPSEEVVALNGVGLDNIGAKVSPQSETEAVEIPSALKFDKSETAEKSWPIEDVRPFFDEEYAPATSTTDYFGDPVEISDVKLPRADFQNAMLSEILVETSPFELKPVPDNVTEDKSAPQFVEDPVLMNLGSPAPDEEDGPDQEIRNGAAAATSEWEREEEKRKSYAEAVMAVVPVIAVGAGAVSTWSGVTSGFEMVGLVATASFLAREIFMASARHQLFGELSKVKDHKSFVEFLKSRQIIKDVPQEGKKW